MITRHPPSPSLRSRIVATGAVLAVLLPALHGAVNPTEWKNQQTFELHEAGLTKIPLPPTTLDLARPGLVDLRLVGPHGEEVPYVVEIAAPPSPVTRPPKYFRIELQKISTQLTIETGTTLPIDRITLATPARDFVKAARVEISADGSQWELAGDGFQLARQPGIDALTLPLGKITAAYVRVTIDDWRTAIVPFTGAMLQLAAADDSFTSPMDAEVVKRDEFARETVLTVDLHARHVPLAFFEFSTTDPLFARVVNVTQREFRNGESVEQSIAIGSIFRSRLPGQSAREHLRVPLNFSPATRELQVHITNENNAPLAIDHLKLQRRPVWLVFNAAEAGAFRLLTGQTQVAAPSYDLARFVADWKSLPDAAAAISPPQPTPGYQRPDTLADTPLLGTTLDVAKWKFRKAVTPSVAGVQELELDLAVLAHADRGLGDLRLMRDGRQAPYLLERSALLRSLPLQLSTVDDPKQPQLSRWKFSLPLAGLPIQRLTFSSRTALFSRRLQVYEITTDHRGESYRRVLYDFVQWNSTPDQPEPKLTISLATAPLTDTLYLETDNGDNPPISLGGAQADYPVIRLLFRADVQPLELYYGADSVTGPRYDLELVAPQLFNEEKNEAKLGNEQRTDGKSGAASSLFSGKRGGILLWVALALVVGVLLYAIARLLPKPPESAAK